MKSLKLKGRDEVSKHLDRLLDNSSDLRDPYKKLVTFLYGRSKEVFKQQKFTKKWEGYKYNYFFWKLWKHHPREAARKGGFFLVFGTCFSPGSPLESG